MKAFLLEVQKCFLILCILTTSFTVLAGNPPGTNKQNWKVNLSGEKMFIRNMGQLSGIPGVAGEALYGIDNSNEQIVFTNKGINYVYLVPQKAGRGPLINFRKEANKEKRMEEMSKLNTAVISMTWKDANPDVKVIAEEVQSSHYLYLNPSSNDPYKCSGYKKITYKNLYNNIDVEYTFHKEKGYKYTILVHPGGDPSKVKMIYSDNSKVISDAMGGILITNSAHGTIQDHAPVSFIGGSKAPVASSFVFSKNAVEFKIGDYDHSKELVIDPWTISPGFAVVDKGYDVMRNPATGDIYVYGGKPPYELKRFTSGGVLISTYVASPFYSAGSTFYGDVTMDAAGDIYLASGCCTGMILKINGTTFSVIWSVSSFSEPWRLAFDIPNNRLIAAGYVGFGGENVVSINPATGALITASTIIAPGNAAEVRGIAMTPTGNIIMLHVSAYPTTTAATNNVSSNTPGLVNQWVMPSGYLLGEEGGYYAINEYSFGGCPVAECFHGFSSFAFSGTHVFTWDGKTIFKRDLATGASMGSVILPSGDAEDVSGVAVDTCGNVYVGTTTGVMEYDENLVFLGASPMGGEVYDVITGGPGELIACGDGFLTSFTPFVPCSTYFITPSGTAVSCNGACDGTATTNTPTGIPPYFFNWSNGDTTQSITGLCAGTYTITVTDSAGTPATSTVTIGSPAALNTTMSSTAVPCGATNGTATVSVSGGTPGYDYSWSPGAATTPTATGLIAGTYIVTVTDTNSCVISDTVIVSQGPPPSLTLSQLNVNCFGDCSGVSSASVSLGTSPYTYLWSNASTGSTASALCAGTYTCITTDFYGCKDTATVTITQPTQMVLNTSFMHCSDELPNGSVIVNASGGTPGYNYAWATIPVQSNDTASSLGYGTYMVTVMDNNGCSGTATSTIPFCPSDTIFVPNVFTPNADGTNDVFMIYNTGYNSLKCEIFNRWGKKVYEWDAINGGWNGKIGGALASDGVYYFMLSAIKFDGTAFSQQGYLQLISN